MRIGFDISQTGNFKAGCGYFAESLIRHLSLIDKKNEYQLYRTFGDSFWDPNFNKTYDNDGPNIRYGLQHRSKEEAWNFWKNSAAHIEKDLGFPDIIHANNFYCPQKMERAKVLFTLYDLSFLEYPEWTTEENRTICFNGVFNSSLYADFIIAISEYSRENFLQVFPHYSPDRAVVIYPASRFSLNSKLSQPRFLSALKAERFWLNVGTIEPRKNHKRLLKAYAMLKAQKGEIYPLVLVGGKGWLMEDFQNEINLLGLKNDVRVLGYLDDVALQWLYQNCFAFIYPSLFEGFGMPVLEALSCGAAVISSSATSLPEIVGDAGVLIDPNDVGQIYKAMDNLLEGRVNCLELKEKALHQSKNFSWDSAAVDTLALYNTVVQQPKRHCTAASSITPVQV